MPPGGGSPLFPSLLAIFYDYFYITITSLLYVPLKFKLYTNHKSNNMIISLVLHTPRVSHRKFVYFK